MNLFTAALYILSRFAKDAAKRKDEVMREKERQARMEGSIEASAKVIEK